MCSLSPLMLSTAVHLSYHTARLPNSEMVQLLPQQLQYLSTDQQHDITELIHRFLFLFNDVPTQTTVLQHDINVKEAKPIKQHPYRQKGIRPPHQTWFKEN